MLTVILTGGASRRMGRDKARLEVNGQPLVALLAERYSALGDVALSAARAEDFQGMNCRVFPDTYPGRGPLNGIVSAFRLTGEDRIFLTAVDIPFGSAELAQRLDSCLGGHDACVIHRSDGRDEPTFAVYSRSCLARAEECLASGRLSFRDLFGSLDLCRVDEKKLSAFELEHILFNMNTQDDYSFVIKQLEEKERTN